MAEVGNIEEFEGDLGGSGSNFNELGMVYEDPMTGKMYMLKDNAQEEE